MKIITPGDPEKTAFGRVTCPNCKAVLEASVGDLERVEYGDGGVDEISGTPIWGGPFNVVRCPECGVRINLRWKEGRRWI